MQLLVEARALDRAFDYLVPASLRGRLERGSLVACPLGRRRVLGVVVSQEEASFAGELVEVAGLVEVPPVPAALLDLALWVARHYLAPVAVCLRLVLPPRAEGALRRRGDGSWTLVAPAGAPERLVASDPVGGGTTRQRAVAEELERAGGSVAAAELCRRAGTTMPTLRRMASAGLLRLEAQAAERSGLDWLEEEPPAADRPRTLTGAQEVAVAAIEEALGRRSEALLLHGVTGSGKTEVYLRAIAAARAGGRSSLVLVPEIALTPQTVRRLRARLGEGVAVWHSGLSRSQRAAEDRRVREGRADVVVGPRSAVFAPLARLGLVVVDEEHEASYKQDSSPRYDARQVAFRRASQEGALVVYGSATPRPESWHALPRVSLPERVDRGRLPPVEVVDMRVQGPGPVSRPLATALQQAMDRGDKAILLLNRRGLARMGLCRACGFVAGCPRCDVALVVHASPERLVCHHCGHESPLPRLCPECGSSEMARQGTGTQGLETALGEIVPDVRLVRLDASSVAEGGSVARRLAQFAAPGPAVLLGTQMVAKGHDLPAITVAGVLDADGALQYPDFRSEERTFSLIVQLAGRAGRRGEPSRVIVQAYEPEGRAVRLGARHAVEEFLEGEIARRGEHGFPPFIRMVRVVLEGVDEPAVARWSQRLRGELAGLDLLGPTRLHRLRSRSRRALLLRSARTGAMTEPLREVLAGVGPALRGDGVRVIVDVDPQAM